MWHPQLNTDVVRNVLGCSAQFRVRPRGEAIARVCKPASVSPVIWKEHISWQQDYETRLRRHRFVLPTSTPHLLHERTCYYNDTTHQIRYIFARWENKMEGERFTFLVV